MPEAPEVQALAERLQAFVGDTTFEGYEPLQFSAIKTVTPAPESIVGSTLDSVGRRGKYVLLNFGKTRIAFHLSQGGRVDVEDPPKKTKPKGSVVRFRFSGPRTVLIKEFGTERKAGWWVLDADDEGPMAKLGPDVETPAFAEFIRSSDDNRRIHTILRDQRTVAGLGRGYTDDVLHRAKISPFASLKSLDADARQRLLDAVSKELADGLELERARQGGLPTKIGDHWVVHKRSGEPCPVCGADLRRVSFESHEITYCPACQTGGKILADRRMSRLIR